MSVVFPSDDPLHGIEFTRQELLDYMQSKHDTLQTDISISPDELIATGAFLSVAFFALKQTTSPDTPEEILIQDEELTSTVAQSVITALGKSIPIAKGKRVSTHDATLTKDIKDTMQTLSPHADTPLKRKKIEAEFRAKQEAKKQEIAELSARIDELEKPYISTGKERRSMTFTQGKEKRNGAWLVKSISELTINGAPTAVFSEESATILAGLSLRPMSETDMNTLRERLNEVAKLHHIIRSKGGQHLGGVFVAIQTLNEVHDSIRTRSNDDPISKLTHFANRLLMQLDATLDPEFVDTLQDGPFKQCEQLYVKPFSGSGYGGRVTATRIDSEDLSAEDIEDDINAAKNKNKGTYIVEKERINDFIRLRAQLIDKHGTTNIRTIRTQSSRWHPLPWYALEITYPNQEHPLVILESPIWGNASYVIDNNDWLKTLYYSKTEAQKMGAEQKPHSEKRLISHFDVLAQRAKEGKRHV